MTVSTFLTAGAARLIKVILLHNRPLAGNFWIRMISRFNCKSLVGRIAQMVERRPHIFGLRIAGSKPALAFLID
jgi:hypothetical protein